MAKTRQARIEFLFRPVRERRGRNAYRVFKSLKLWGARSGRRTWSLWSSGRSRSARHARHSWGLEPALRALGNAHRSLGTALGAFHGRIRISTRRSKTHDDSLPFCHQLHIAKLMQLERLQDARIRHRQYTARHHDLASLHLREIEGKDVMQNR